MLDLAALTAFVQILLIDVSLAGDNALAVGVAAVGLPIAQRHKAVILGILVATVLRIVFALFAVQLLHITGLLAAGGLLLVWVAWKMVRTLRHQHQAASEQKSQTVPHKTLGAAILQIVAADALMSLDNVLAVAGVARDNQLMLVAGLIVSTLLMGGASAYVARLTTRYVWFGYLGVAVILLTALRMVAEGIVELVQL